jgi:Ca2+-binding EF-hand superfamily protein
VLKAKFAEIDADGSGALDAAELAALFEGLGKPVSVGTLANLLRLSDADGSGTIDYDEFEKIVAQCK